MKKLLFVASMLLAGFQVSAQEEEPESLGTFYCTAGSSECADAQTRRASVEFSIIGNTGCSATQPPCANYIGKTYTAKLIEVGTESLHKCSDIHYTYTVYASRVATGFGGDAVDWVVSLKSTETVPNNAEGCIPEPVSQELYFVYFNTMCHGSPAMVFTSLQIALTSGAGTYKIGYGSPDDWTPPIGGFCWAIAAIGGE